MKLKRWQLALILLFLLFVVAPIWDAIMPAMKAAGY